MGWAEHTSSTWGTGCYPARRPTPSRGWWTPCTGSAVQLPWRRQAPRTVRKKDLFKPNGARVHRGNEHKFCRQPIVSPFRAGEDGYDVHHASLAAGENATVGITGARVAKLLMIVSSARTITLSDRRG